MIRGFYSAGSGLKAQQSAIDNTANNMSNLSTSGFKKQELSFSELMYSNLASPNGSAPQEMKVGSGSRAVNAASLHTQGRLEQTNNPLDFALTGDGFFGILCNDGTVKYTRDGSFHVSSEETGSYLVTAVGGYVLGKDGNRVLLDGENPTEKIGVFGFANPYGLTRAGENLFESTESSGNAFLHQGEIRSGCLEC
jgi:flagellar basal-body rod protein FlgG